MTETGVQPPVIVEKVKGKSFMLKGSFNYWAFEEQAKEAITKLGGTIADVVTAELSYLVAEGRGSGDSKKQAEKLNKAGASIQIISEADLKHLLSPTREEAIAMLTSGDELQTMWNAVVRMDITKVDLQNLSLNDMNLGQASFVSANLLGADLSGCKFARSHFSKVKSVDFSNCEFTANTFERAEECMFIGARFIESLLQMHAFRCDFSHADFTEVKAPAMKAHDTIFRGAYFTSAILISASLRQCDFSNIMATYSDWSGANLPKSQFIGADFSNAVLDGVDFTESDLTGANFSNASLVGANLKGTVIKGANFEGARLNAADFTGVDTTNAVNLKLPEEWTPPAISQNMLDLQQAFTQAAKTVYQVSLGLTLDFGTRRQDFWIMWVEYQKSAWIRFQPAQGLIVEVDKAATVSEALLMLARRYHDSKLDVTSINVVMHPQLVPIATAALCDAFGIDGHSVEELRKEAEQRNERNRESLVRSIRGGASGVAEWNKNVKRYVSDGASIKKLDLSNCEIDGADFRHEDMSGTNFKGTKLTNIQGDSVILTKSNLSDSTIENFVQNGANMKECDFTNAKLTKCSWWGTAFAKAKFKGTVMDDCVFVNSDFKNCDLSEAKITNCNFSRTQFNENTKFPPGFEMAVDMVWAGKGKSPLITETLEKAAAAGPVDFETFMKNLEESVDRDRLKKAISMLKKDSFQLFADVKDDSVVGIVKSQSDSDLVYSCRLTSEGIYACCSHNLNPCGGLRGALCKHLLVLIIGLSKQGSFDTTTGNIWVKASQLQKPQLDKDIMSETLLRYKGAEAGEIDWRPTETLPEDYYAF